MKIRIRPWYVAMAFWVPRKPLPACLVFGIPGYSEEALAVAAELAEALLGVKKFPAGPEA